MSKFEKCLRLIESYKRKHRELYNQDLSDEVFIRAIAIHYDHFEFMDEIIGELDDETLAAIERWYL